MKIFTLMILGACVMAVIYLYSRLDQQRQEIQALSNLVYAQNVAQKDSLTIVEILEVRRANEEFVLAQTGFRSDWVIFYVTILFGLFGFFGFEAFDKRIQVLIQSTHTKIEAHNEENKREIHEIQKLRGELYVNAADSYMGMAIQAEEPVFRFMFYLHSAFYYSQSVHLETQQEKEEKLTSACISTIESALTALKRADPDEERNKQVILDDFDEIYHKLSEIGDLNYVDIKDACARITVLVNKFRNK